MTVGRDTMKAVLEWSLPNGAVGINVLHVLRQDLATPTNADCLQVAEDLVDWYENTNFKGETNVAFRSVISDDASLQQVVVSDSDPGPTVQATVGSGMAGSVTGTPLPNESSVVISFTTSTPGRSGKGRMFVPAVPVAFMESNGTLLLAYANNYLDAFDALIDGWAAEGDYVLAVYSPTIPQSDSVLTNVVRDIVHHQRRRNS